MVYVKKLVMHGFKSFAKKTEIPFTQGINVILGPNGSGKSNVSDALCFVLGRLSVKSMRAAKSKNLIFQGTKQFGPSKEAVVELIFDNSDRKFTIDKDEVSIKRIVRKNGQSIYKINNETKTRQEILTLLSQTGIDPNGFNIILQGEIQNFVKMHTEERRKIIEEVSGISVYEARKEKSLKELDKTEEKLKEIVAILRERTAYLNNLEKERQQALRFKKLQEDTKKYKASIINFDLKKREKEKGNIEEEIGKKNKEIEKVKKTITNAKTIIKNLEDKINCINSTIQQSTGLGQEKLNQEIANLRADLAGMNVKMENYDNKISNIQKQESELENSIRENELSLKELQKESPTVVKKQKEIEDKKQELEKLEEERKKFYMMKSELKSIEERLQDKKSTLQGLNTESEFLIKQIESFGKELFDRNTTSEILDKLKIALDEKKDILENIGKREIELEKIIHTNEYEIEKQSKLMETVSKMDICPLCKNKITETHIGCINSDTKPKVEKLEKEISNSDKELSEIANKRNFLKQEIEKITSEISKRESDINKLKNIEDKKEQIKAAQEKIEKTKQEIDELEKRKNSLSKSFDQNTNVEQKYETVRIEIQEISLRTEENVNSEISFKQRELERAKISIKQLNREESDLSESLYSTKKSIKEKEVLLERKRKQEEELAKKFEKLIEERDKYQKQIREQETEALNKQNIIHNIEGKINNFKIDRARVDAEIENLEIEILEFSNIEIIKSNRENLVHKLNSAQETIGIIGSVNLRSLEVYDEIKKEYDSIKEKVETIASEKESILKIVHEIDIKKKKTFMKTFEELNEIFSRNFAQISTKGQVSLELENKKDPFEAGVGIVVKTGHGKYFDVTSLSGGEQTMVALSLIFGIQELNPYCFYILDEIDAALDKRNSERLAVLLNKYMQKGQYIIITHNDEVITRATNLYGISMHDGVSKITSLKV
jgi:chromosome segregation protein